MQINVQLLCPQRTETYQLWNLFLRTTFLGRLYVSHENRIPDVKDLLIQGSWFPFVPLYRLEFLFTQPLPRVFHLSFSYNNRLPLDFIMIDWISLHTVRPLRLLRKPSSKNLFFMISTIISNLLSQRKRAWTFVQALSYVSYFGTFYLYAFST